MQCKLHKLEALYTIHMHDNMAMDMHALSAGTTYTLPVLLVWEA